jgi:hypothetical protein
MRFAVVKGRTTDLPEGTVGVVDPSKVNLPARVFAGVPDQAW